MARPWEQETVRPWEAPQSLYPRTVVITRPIGNAAVGVQGYKGTTKGKESVVVGGLPASIQFTGRLATPLGGTPSDATDRAGFRILIPLSAAPQDGTITERDIVTSDLQKRYQVFAGYWDSLGYNLQVELLEA